MLDTGFEPDIRKLEELGLTPKDERVTSMFSATFPVEVQQLAKHFLRDNYVFLAVGTLGGANEDIAQTIEEVPQSEKKNRLFSLLDENLSKRMASPTCRISFCLLSSNRKRTLSGLRGNETLCRLPGCIAIAEETDEHNDAWRSNTAATHRSCPTVHEWSMSSVGRNVGCGSWFRFPADWLRCQL